jgi:hypothetical protein
MEHPTLNSYAHNCAERSEYFVNQDLAWALVGMIRAYNSDLFYESEKWATAGEKYVRLDSFIKSVAYGIIITAMMDGLINKNWRISDEKNNIPLLTL